jgi:hypothetical protein
MIESRALRLIRGALSFCAGFCRFIPVSPNRNNVCDDVLMSDRVV